jgi:hypothetical protein
MFRINFLTTWITMNIAYSIIVENYGSNSSKTVINDGSVGFLEVFAAYLAILVCYRVFFGGLHILNFKFKRICCPKYYNRKFDLHEEFKKLRSANDWNESVHDNDMKLLEDAASYNDGETLYMDEESTFNGRRTTKGGKSKLD